MEACRTRGAGVLLPVSALPSPYECRRWEMQHIVLLINLACSRANILASASNSHYRVWKQSLPVLFRVCGKSLFH